MGDEPRRILGDRASIKRAPLWIWHATEESRLNHPLGQGWFFKVRMSDTGELDGLMDEAAYRDWVKTL